MTNSSKPQAANLPALSAITVPVDYSQPTGLASMLADIIVSGCKVVSYLRQISAADFVSGEYSFPTPADYKPAPYQLPMLEPTSWNVVADVITAYQPVEVYQIGSKTDLMQSTFPIIINPTDYANSDNTKDPIKPLAEGQSVTLRIYKVASAGINWAGSNIVNNGLTDEAVKSLTQLTLVVTNISGVYTVTDWIGVDFITNGLSSLKTSAKGSFAAVVNELFDTIVKNKTDLENALKDKVSTEALAVALKKYLPLSGGTLTNGIEIDRDLGITASFGVDTGGAYMLVSVDGKQAGILYLNSNGLTYTDAEGRRNAIWHSGNFDPGQYLSYKGGIPGANMDNATSPGIYSYGPDAANHPTPYGTLLVLVAPGPWIVQIAFGTENNHTYYRKKTNYAAWTPWRMLWDSGNLKPTYYAQIDPNGNIVGQVGGWIQSVAWEDNGYGYNCSIIPKVPVNTNTIQVTRIATGGNNFYWMAPVVRLYNNEILVYLPETASYHNEKRYFNISIQGV